MCSKYRHLQSNINFSTSKLLLYIMLLLTISHKTPGFNLEPLTNSTLTHLEYKRQKGTTTLVCMALLTLLEKHYHRRLGNRAITAGFPIWQQKWVVMLTFTTVGLKLGGRRATEG